MIVLVGLKIVFVKVWLARYPPTWEMVVNMAGADDVFGLAKIMLSFHTGCLG